MTPDYPTNTRPVSIRTEFPGSALDEVFTAPVFAVLHQSLKSHDVLKLRFASDLKEPSKVLRSGAPVTMTWGINSYETRTWVGYVHTTSPRRESDSTYSTEVTCVSPSMILTTGSQDVWNSQVDQVLTDIISRSLLSPLVQRHPLQKNVLAAGRTYWQVLRDLATEIGFSLICEGVQVIMVPHRWWFDQYHALAKIFHPGSSVQTPARTSDRTLYSFTPQVSDRLSNEFATSAAMQSWWVDPFTASFGSETTTEPTDQIGVRSRSAQTFGFTERVSRSPAESARRAADKLADKRWVQQGELVGLGSPLVSPYRPIYVTDYHTAADGWWQVLEVTHTINKLKTYEVTATVGRDGDIVSYPAPTLRDIPTIPPEVMANPKPAITPSFNASYANVSGQMGFGDIGGRWTAAYAA